jgi:hypothetical protein
MRCNRPGMGAGAPAEPPTQWVAWPSAASFLRRICLQSGEESPWPLFVPYVPAEWGTAAGSARADAVRKVPHFLLTRCSRCFMVSLPGPPRSRTARNSAPSEITKMPCLERSHVSNGRLNFNRPFDKGNEACHAGDTLDAADRRVRASSAPLSALRQADVA